MQDFKNEILVVVESIDAESSSGAKANIAFIKNLQKCGYELTVLHYSGKEVEQEGLNVELIRENKKSLFFFLSRFEAKIRSSLKWSINRSIENFFGFSLKLFSDRDSIVQKLRKMKPGRFKLVITLSQGGSFRPHHALLKLPEWHYKWLAYIHDPYPMHHFPAPYTWTEPGSGKKEAFIREVSEKAAFSAFPARLLLEWMGQFYPYFLKTGVVIPHQLIDTNVEPTEVHDWFHPDKFSIVHAGNLLQGRNPKGLVEGFRKFLEKKPEAVEESLLVFLGAKNYYSSELAAYQKELPQIFLSERNLPFLEVQQIQNHSSVNVIIEAKAHLSPFLPGKFPHCVAANKPILLLGPPTSESRRLLGKNYPFWAEIDEANQIADVIEELYSAWIEKKTLSLDRPDLMKYLSWNHLKEIMNQILEDTA